MKKITEGEIQNMWKRAFKLVVTYEAAVDRWVKARRQGQEARQEHEQLVWAKVLAHEAVRQCRQAETQLQRLKARVTKGPGPGALSIADLESPKQVLKWHIS